MRPRRPALTSAALTVVALTSLALVGLPTVTAEDAETPKRLPRYERKHTLEGHEGIVRSVVFRPGTHTLVSGGADRSVRIWNGDTGRALGEHVLPRSG